MTTISVQASIPAIKAKTASRPVTSSLATGGVSVQGDIVKAKVSVKGVKATVSKPIVMGPTDARQEVFAQNADPGVSYPATNFVDVTGFTGLKRQKVNA